MKSPQWPYQSEITGSGPGMCGVCMCVCVCVCVFESLPQQLPVEKGGRELVHCILSQ